MTYIKVRNLQLVFVFVTVKTRKGRCIYYCVYNCCH